MARLDDGLPGGSDCNGGCDRVLRIDQRRGAVSRVHDALRRAEHSGLLSPPVNRPATDARAAAGTVVDAGPNLAGLLEQVEEIPFRTASDSLLIDVSRPHEAPMEEFRTL